MFAMNAVCGDCQWLSMMMMMMVIVNDDDDDK